MESNTSESTQDRYKSIHETRNTKYTLSMKVYAFENAQTSWRRVYVRVEDIKCG